MKKIVLPILLSGLLYSAYSFAQAPVITSINNWQFGDKQIILTADSVKIEPGKSGANVTWDFSGLKPDSANDSSITTFMDPSKTPYWSNFPKANIVEVDAAGSNYNYFNLSSSQVEDIGIESYDTSTATATKVAFSNTFIVAKYPFTFGDTHSDTYAASATVQGFKIFLNGKLNSVADAYGTLKIRSKTYKDVLRIKTINITKDSLDFGLGHSITYDTSTSYTYVTPGKKSPILTITYDANVQGPPQPNTTYSKTVTFNDFDRVHNAGIENSPAENISVSLYPNPSSGIANLVLDATNSSEVSIRITNGLGQLVQEYNNKALASGKNTISLNLNNCAKGIYFVNINDGTSARTEKLVIR